MPVESLEFRSLLFTKTIQRGWRVEEFETKKFCYDVVRDIKLGIASEGKIESTTWIGIH